MPHKGLTEVLVIFHSAGRRSLKKEAAAADKPDVSMNLLDALRQSLVCSLCPAMSFVLLRLSIHHRL
jgi:hypothetical protein